MIALVSDGARLLEAIRAEPRADDLRLVYADWLDDSGEGARAEFVRRQIVAAPPAPPAPPGCVFWEWFGGGFGPAFPGAASAQYTHNGPARVTYMLGDGGPPSRWHVDVLRGFPHAVRLPLAAWDAHGAAVLAAHPVERVELSDKVPQLLDAPRAGWRREWGREATMTSLPESLFALLQGGTPTAHLTHDGKPCWIDYPDERAALDSLSAALIEWKRPPR